MSRKRTQYCVKHEEPTQPDPDHPGETYCASCLIWTLAPLKSLCLIHRRPFWEYCWLRDELDALQRTVERRREHDRRRDDHGVE